MGKLSSLQKTILNTAKYGVIVLMFIIICILAAAISIISDFPSQKQIRGCLTTKMYHVNLCPTSGQYTPLSQISSYVVKSIVLSEDSAFYAHRGFDFDEIEKSIKKNIQTKKYARGGSTITQQLAKNMFLTEEKSLLRKLKEAVITVQLEKNLSKKEILEKYLNVVHLGKDLFGIKNASQFYFKKSPAELTVAESAFIAFLLPSPEKYSRSYFKKELTPFAEKRLNQIIDNLYQYQRITEAEHLQGKEGIKNLFKGAAPEALPAPELDAPEEEADIEND